MNAYVCMPRLSLKKAKLDREIFVVSLASDLRGKSNHRPAASGAANEPLDTIVSGIDSALEFMVVAVSNVFHHIDKDQPVPLGGDGIVLYPPADPNGMLSLHLSVVESDKAARHLGKALTRTFADEAVKETMEEIGRAIALARGVPEGLLSRLMVAAASSLSAALESSQDDVLIDYAYSSRAISSYGGSRAGTEYRVSNRKVEGIIRVHVDA